MNEPTHQLASIRRRAIALFIDYLLFAFFHTLFMMQFGTKSIAEDGRPVYEVEGILNIVPVIVWLLTFPVMESFEGQTLGKKLMGLKVIKMDGSHYGFLESLKRRICDWLDFALLGLPALIISHNTPFRQRLGDMWAKTCVIRVFPQEVSS